MLLYWGWNTMREEDKLEHIAAIARAESAIKQFELDIYRKKMEIKKKEDHIVLQKKLIREKQEALNNG